MICRMLLIDHIQFHLKWESSIDFQNKTFHIMITLIKRIYFWVNLNLGPKRFVAIS